MKEYARDWWSRISVTDRRRLVTVAIKYPCRGFRISVVIDKYRWLPHYRD